MAVSSFLSRDSRRRLKIISLIVLILSLFMPTFFGSDMRGFQVLTMGWISWAAGDWVLGMCWIGLLSIIASLIVSPGKKGLRLGLALYSLFSLLVMGFASKVPLDDLGAYMPITPGIGYMIWTLGCIGLFIYHLERFRQQKA